MVQQNIKAQPDLVAEFMTPVSSFSEHRTVSEPNPNAVGQDALKSRTAGDSEWWVPEPWGCRVSAGRYRLGHLLCRLSGTWSQVLSLHRPHQVMFSAFCKFVSEEIGSSNLCLKGVCTLPPCWIHPHPLNTSRCQCKTWICPSWMWTITPFYCYFIIWDFPVYLLIFKCF